MAKIEFEHSKSAVNRAGVALVTGAKEDHERAKSVLDNWRACHVAPLNSFQTSLRRKLSIVDCDALVSQRLKRMPSILAKLERNPGMQLVRMQDVGGIRSVVKDMTSVRKIQSEYKNGTRVFSIVKGGKDYINYPKDSGYRSIHMMFKCKNGFSIELQLRTIIQHAWATAVETMGTFLNHSLKSSEGPDEWLSFFVLASSAFSILESTPRVPEHDRYSEYEVFDMLLKKEVELNVLNKLSGFRVVAKHIESEEVNGHYHLITLDLDTRKARVKSYAKRDAYKANTDYSEVEELVSQGQNLQVVLVTSKSIATLKKAYPSYFLDAQLFAKQVSAVKKRFARMKA